MHKSELLRYCGMEASVLGRAWHPRRASRLCGLSTRLLFLLADLLLACWLYIQYADLRVSPHSKLYTRASSIPRLRTQQSVVVASPALGYLATAPQATIAG